MYLQPPDENCQHCQGTGGRVRDLRLLIAGQPASAKTKVMLHCSCLSPKLEDLHLELDKEDVLREWPDVTSWKIPKPNGGPAVAIISNPFPIMPVVLDPAPRLSPTAPPTTPQPNKPLPMEDEKTPDLTKPQPKVKKRGKKNKKRLTDDE